MFVEELKNNNEWEEFLYTSPNGTFYHSLKWKEVIERSFPHCALYLTIKDVNGRLVGICPGFIQNTMHIKAYNSTPYSDYGGPVIIQHFIRQGFLSLLDFFQNYYSKESIAYTKVCLMNDELVRSFQFPSCYADESKGIVEVDLKSTPSDFLWNKFLSNHMRKKIRVIERDGFQVQEARTKSDLLDFYNLYYRNMKYIGASPYKYEFMENTWDILHPENLRIWFVEKNQRIGGMVVFKYGLRTYVRYVGIDRRHSRVYSVATYLFWKEIKKAEEEGYRYVSFGSTSSDAKDIHYLQKTGLGGLFFPQRVVWYPFSYAGRVLLQTRTKARQTWATIRNFLPRYLRVPLESELSRY
jgi:hypothetical protein